MPSLDADEHEAFACPLHRGELGGAGLAAAPASAWPPLLKTFGSPGNGPGQFQPDVNSAGGINAIAAGPDGSIYVADSLQTSPPSQARIQRFSPDGSHLGSWDPVGIPGYSGGRVGGLAVAPSGTLWAAVSAANPSTPGWGVFVESYAPDGSLISRWQASQVGYATGLALAPDGSLYVSDATHWRVVRYSGDGTLLSTFGSVGSGEGQFRGPGPLVADQAGKVYVVDHSTFNMRIEVFTAQGGFLADWQNQYWHNSNVTGGYGYLAGLSIEPNGLLLASLGTNVDPSLRAVALSPADGSIVDQLDAAKPSPSNGPIAGAPSGRILLADEPDSQVMVFGTQALSGGGTGSAGGGGGGTGGGTGSGSGGGTGGGGGGTVVAPKPPAISALTVRPSRFRVAHGRSGGTRFRFKLSARSSVRISIVRRSGRRMIGVGVLRYSEPAGARALRFTGRIGRRSLAAGSYRATFTAQDSRGLLSVPRSVSFAVLA